VRTRYDQFAKETLTAVLSHAGHVETEVEVAAEAQYVDLVCEPDPARLDALAPFGLLGRMVREGPCMLEFFHSAPSTGDVLGCIQKQIERRRRRDPKIASEPCPLLWIIAAGRPIKAFRELGFGGDGPIAALAVGWGVRLISVIDLPAERDTLLLRLLGTGAVLRRAAAELARLGSRAPERMAVQRIVLRFIQEVERLKTRSREEEEFLMTTRDTFDEWEREVREEGMQTGIGKGIEKGIASSVLDTYEARFGAVPPALAARIHATGDTTLLRQWLRIVATAAREDVERLIAEN
jgi:hypothetical protein